MHLVGALFRDEVHRSSGVKTALCARRAGRDFKLLQRVGKRDGHISIVMDIVVISPIQRVTQACVESTRDRKTGRRE